MPFPRLRGRPDDLRSSADEDRDSSAIAGLIVAREAGRWRVKAVLDWEYACAGTATGDLGNLLRPPFDTAAGFEAAVIGGYRNAGGTLPDRWKDLALLADLFAWLEFLGRAQLDRNVANSARHRIVYTMNAIGPTPAG